jgi:hypothetical protein
MQDPSEFGTVFAGHDGRFVPDDQCGRELAAAYRSRCDHQRRLLSILRTTSMSCWRPTAAAFCRASTAAQSFVAANDGFSQRQVEALLVDSRTPNTIYAGVLNDKTYGGVFVSEDGGNTWSQRSIGLDGRDIFTLRRRPTARSMREPTTAFMSLSDTGWDLRGNSGQHQGRRDDGHRERRKM